jgi:hypothetical protein
MRLRPALCRRASHKNGAVYARVYRIVTHATGLHTSRADAGACSRRAPVRHSCPLTGPHYGPNQRSSCYGSPGSGTPACSYHGHHSWAGAHVVDRFSRAHYCSENRCAHPMVRARACGRGCIARGANAQVYLFARRVHSRCVQRFAPALPRLRYSYHRGLAVGESSGPLMSDA